MEIVFIDHRRYSFAGDELLSSRYHRRCIGHTQPQAFLCADLHPMGEEGLYLFRTFTMYARTKDFTTDLASDFALCFNYGKGRLEERHFTGKDLVPRIVDAHGYVRYQPCDFVLWKDVYISIQIGGLKFSTENADVQASQVLLSTVEDRYTTFEANYDSRPKRLWVKTSFPDIDHNLFINDSFLVVVAQSPADKMRQIHVFCFEDGLECAGFEDAGVRNDL
ncbi:hypothetical protein PRZ48_012991 [Zasmidium cellare]|uniref:Uncharacterized protein n=1 Tax=Zasmidium cellare TaxID=395010 RepID=A0ABR0E2S2_ZASCE|nr:hypothetical protein PRZ48_012991 [Zasmidium cellare]